jgi:hypothetical protein
MRMISGGKWAPLKLIAIVVLLHDVLLVMEGDHTANGLKYNFATKPKHFHCMPVYRILRMRLKAHAWASRGAAR